MLHTASGRKVRRGVVDTIDDVCLCFCPSKADGVLYVGVCTTNADFIHFTGEMLSPDEPWEDARDRIIATLRENGAIADIVAAMPNNLLTRMKEQGLVWDKEFEKALKLDVKTYGKGN